MTALCPGGGPSQERPAYAGTTAFGVPFFTALFAEDWPVAMAALAAGALGFIAFDTFQICQSDPPAMPTLSATDWLALFAGTDIYAKGQTIQKLHDTAVAKLWPILCECISGATPSPPAAPPVPPGLQINPPTSVPGFQNPPCWNWAGHALVPYSTTCHAGAPPSSQIYQWGNPVTQAIPSVGKFPTPLPPSISYTMVTNNDGGNPGPLCPTWFVFNSSNTTIFNGPLTGSGGWNPGQTWTETIDLTQHPTAVGAGIWVDYNNSGGARFSNTFDLTLNINCVGPNNIVQPCCPPDGTLQSLLQQLLTSVTLIQRQAVPFAYVPGATHSGLTGSGALTVQGLLGVKVLPSSIPPDAGVVIGDPDTLWLDSWINWGNADGWTAREFLRSSPYVSLPNLAGQFTQIGYTLRPGMSVDIVELVREP